MFSDHIQSPMINVSYKSSVVVLQVKVLVFSAVGLALSGFVLGLPFLIYGPKYTVQELLNTSANSSIQVGLNIGEKATMASRCAANSTSQSNASESGRYRHAGAFAIQMIGGVINGIAACPFWNIGICFLDDMAGKKSGGYLGELHRFRKGGKVKADYKQLLRATSIDNLRLTKANKPETDVQ